VVGLLLIIQVPDASDKRGVAVPLCPIDRFPLCPESAQHVVGMIFDHIIVDMAPLRAALGSRFNVNICHVVSPGMTFIGKLRIAQGTRREDPFLSPDIYSEDG
jgi:hypothetical protein